MAWASFACAASDELPIALRAANPSLPLGLASGSLTPDLGLELERTTTIKCLPKPFSLAELLALLPHPPQ